MKLLPLTKPLQSRGNLCQKFRLLPTEKVETSENVLYGGGATNTSVPHRAHMRALYAVYPIGSAFTAKLAVEATFAVKALPTLQTKTSFAKCSDMKAAFRPTKELLTSIEACFRLFKNALKGLQRLVGDLLSEVETRQ